MNFQRELMRFSLIFFLFISVICLIVIFVHGSQTRPKLVEEEKSGDSSKKSIIGDNNWPSIVSVVKGPNGEFLCGGVLISQKHILCIADCLKQNESKVFTAEDLKVIVKEDSDKISKKISVLEIVLHPDWNFDEGKLLAILQLAEPPQSRSYAQLSRAYQIGNGFAVGLMSSGAMTHLTTFEHTDSETDCTKIYPLPSKVSSNETFCCNFKAQTESHCLSNAGSVFYFNKLSNWTLSGILLKSTCEVALFINVAAHVEWIDGVINNS